MDSPGKPGLIWAPLCPVKARGPGVWWGDYQVHRAPRSEEGYG